MSLVILDLVAPEGPLDQEVSLEYPAKMERMVTMVPLALKEVLDPQDPVVYPECPVSRV